VYPNPVGSSARIAAFPQSPGWNIAGGCYVQAECNCTSCRAINAFPPGPGRALFQWRHLKNFAAGVTGWGSLSARFPNRGDFAGNLTRRSPLFPECHLCKSMSTINLSTLKRYRWTLETVQLLHSHNLKAFSGRPRAVDKPEALRPAPYGGALGKTRSGYQCPSKQRGPLGGYRKLYSLSCFL